MTTTAQDVIKLTSPTDIVGLVPYLLGFAPAESLVVMSLRGPRKRSGLTLRIDLPQAEHHGPLAEEMSARAKHDGASAVALLCYTEDGDDGGDLPRRDLVDKLVARLADFGIGLTEVLLVRGGRWSSYTCEQTCCPRTGTAVPTRVGGAVARIAAESVLDGRVVLADRAALQRSVRPSSSRITHAALHQAYDRVGERLTQELVDGVGVAVETLRLLRVAVAARAEGRPLPSLDEAARIVLGLRQLEARDEAITCWLDGHVEALLGVLVDLCRNALDLDAAPVCAVLAYVAYAEGDGGLANVAADRALSCEPGYGLAMLVHETLDRQVPPSGVQETLRHVRRDLRERAAGRARRTRGRRRR